MTLTAQDRIEAYLTKLRAELERAGTADSEDMVAEIRSLLTDAAQDDAGRAAVEIGRLGEPADLAKSILVERGLDAADGMPAGVWWRLGIAAPIDIAIGLALPLVVLLPAYTVAASGEPRLASILIGLCIGLAALLWPLWIWRPWRTGGTALSPGMTLTGLAIVRGPGTWRLVRTTDLESLGLAPRRRIGAAIVILLLGLVLLAGVVVAGLDVGRSSLATALLSSSFDGGDALGGDALRHQVRAGLDTLYADLGSDTGQTPSDTRAIVTPEAEQGLQALRERIREKAIVSVQVGPAEAVGAGLYRFAVRELAGGSRPVGTSTFTVGLRQWRLPDGVGTDWVIVDIAVGSGPAGK